MFRNDPILRLAGGSLAALAVLVYLLRQESPPTPEVRPLRVFCAAALKPPMQAIAAAYQSETGQVVEFEFGDSGHILTAISLRPGGDLFLPADDSFVRLARDRGLVAETIPLCRMRAVILVRAGGPPLTTFEELVTSGLKIGLADPDSAAIGKVVRSHLTAVGKWTALASHLTTRFATVTASANAAKLGSIDAAIVWDPVAFHYPELKVVHVPELDGAIGRVELAVLSGSPDPAAARRLTRYIVASDRGGKEFQRSGFTDVEAGPPWLAPGGEP